MSANSAPGSYWFPSEIGDSFEMVIDANQLLTQGQLKWSAFTTTGGGVQGNFLDVNIVDGIYATATKGTRPDVLNNETGGGNGYEAADFRLRNTNASASIDVTSIEIEGLKSSLHTSAYSEIALYRDQTGSGTVGSFDTGDVLIGSAITGSMTGTPPVATFAVQSGEQTFAAGDDRQYFIVIKLNGSATTNELLDYRVSAVATNSSGMSLRDGGVASAVMYGVRIDGDEAIIDSGTFVSGSPVVLGSQTDLPVGAFAISASQTAAQAVSAIRIQRAGSITDGDISAVKLWVDTNNNGVIDTGETTIGGNQTFSSGEATFSGSPLLNLSASQSVNIIVTYSYGTLSNNTTIGFSLTAASDITSSSGTPRENTPPTNPTFLKWLVDSFPYVQNFDAFPYSGYTPNDPHPLVQGWYNDLADGGYDWMVYRNSTPYSGTGPSADHTTGTSSGYYLYVPDASVTSATSPVNLITPPMDISGLTLPAFEFWFHNLVGQSANPSYENTLHVDLIDVSTGNVTQDIITAIKGNSNAAWQLMTIDLSSVTASVIQVQFRWVGTGSSVYNDIAIDDVSVRDLPDINVKNGSNMTVAAGGTDAVGTVLNTVTTTLNYTIENNGGVDLTVSTVTFSNHSNVSPSATVLSSSPAATVTAGSTTTFDVQFNPIGAGAFQFDVTVTTNDPDTPNYTFTVSGTGQANAGPTISIPTTGSNWQANGSNFELFVDPGAAINDSLTADDPTPDNITITVTPPATTLTTLTTSPVTGGGTASTISMDWVGTADATNAPTGYVWQIQISDGITNVNFTATIFVNDLAPTSAAGTSATGGNGQGTATPYTGSALVGSTAALTLADMTNPNTGQAMTLGTITPDAGNPAGGSGFTVTFVADSIVLTPTAALQLADVGTHAFAVDIDDAGNTTTVYVSVDVVTPEIDVARNATPIADGGTDTITGALAGQSMVLTYDITNNGTSDLTITTVVLSTLVNCTANVTANPAGTVTPTNSTSFAVTVTPGVGAFSFDIAINNDDVDEDPYDIAASGNAAAAPEIDVDRAGTPIADGGSDAPTTTYTGTGNDLVYTITNNGTSDLIITSITTGGLVNCTATVTVPATSPIAPGNSADFTVQYTPTADGPTSFTISIVNNDANESPYDITVNATSTPAPSSGGSGGGGGGGCASSTDSTLPVMALLALFMLGAVVYRRRRA
ncbi:MAG: DUF1573 domain-containing protein [Planctomycetota bacterium]